MAYKNVEAEFCSYLLSMLSTLCMHQCHIILINNTILTRKNFCERYFPDSDSNSRKYLLQNVKVRLNTRKYSLGCRIDINLTKINVLSMKKV